MIENRKIASLTPVHRYGSEARDLTATDGIYRQSYQYDVWANLTGRGVNRFFRLSTSSFGLSRLDVSHNDRNSQPSSGNCGEQEEDHRETGVAKYSKRSFHSHQHRSPNYQRGEYQSERNSVCYFLQPLNDYLFINSIHIDFEFVVSNHIQNLVNPARKFFDKLFHFDGASNQVCRSDALKQIALKNFHGALADNCGWLKGGIERKYDAVEIQQSFSDHREFRGKPKPAVSGYLCYFQHHLARVEPA